MKTNTMIQNAPQGEQPWWFVRMPLLVAFAVLAIVLAAMMIFAVGGGGISSQMTRWKSTDVGDVIGIDLGTTNSCVAIMVSYFFAGWQERCRGERRMTKASLILGGPEWVWPTLLLAAVTLAFTGCKPSGGGGTIKVGEFASLTGKEATFGGSSHEGTLLAIEELNAAGGVLGKKIKLIT